MQIKRAARTLVVQPGSQVLQKNMNVFREAWRENVTLLTTSVDAIAPLLDFLLITGVCGTPKFVDILFNQDTLLCPTPEFRTSCSIRMLFYVLEHLSFFCSKSILHFGVPISLNMAQEKADICVVTARVVVLLLAEAHLHEDGQSLMEAVKAGDEETTETAAHLMRGRCNRFTHIIKTELAENPALYSAEKKEQITRQVHHLESKCQLFTFSHFEAYIMRC